MVERAEPRVVLEHAASPAQQRLWFVEQLAPGAPVHNICVELELGPELVPNVLAAAVDDVVERHEALRTVFRAEDGELRQVVMSGLEEAPVRLCDVRSAEPDGAETAWQAERDEAACAAFDLQSGPLLRLVLVRTTDADYRLVIVVHHIVSDGLSSEIFLRDFMTAYKARKGGGAPEFDSLPVQYADFTEWQRQRLSTPEAMADLAYWRGQLADLPTIDLTRGRPRPDDLGHDGSEIAVDISPEVTETLRRESARHGATLFMALAALWVEAVGRWFGTTDVPIGTPTLGRPIPEVQDVIGLFVDRAVLRIDRSGRPSFRDLLARARDVVLAANDHSAVTFEQVVAAIQPERQLGVTPLFQVAINLVPLTEISGGQFGNGTVRHDLNLELLPLDGGIAARVEFRHGVIDTADARGVANLFERLLAFAVDDSASPLRSVPTCLESRESIRDGGRTNHSDLTLYRAFAAQAARTPDLVAVETPLVRLSYRDLADRAASVAVELAKRGVGAETPVILVAPRRAELIVAMLGILASGGVYVPVDPAAPSRHMERVCATAGARIAVVVAGERVSLPDGMEVVTVDLDTPTESATLPVTRVDPANAAYVLFTSGTTGTPKGVVVEHRHVMAYVRAIGALTGPGDGASYLMVQPPTFDSCVTQIYGALLSGGTLHLVDEDLARDAAGLADYCAKHPIDFLKIVPSHLSALLSAGRSELRPARAAIIGGEGSTREFVGGLIAAGWPVIGHYGPTETTVGVLAEWLTTDSFAHAPSTPLGKPIAGVRAYVLDDAFEPVPPGGTGELYIGGDLVTRGYAGEPGRTAVGFLPDPYADWPGQRMYRTGDVVRPLPTGGYEFLGRADRQVKVRGYRIEPAAVEATLERHPGVRQAVVVVRDGRLVAYVIPRVGILDLEESQLHEHLRVELPASAEPAAFVMLAELPHKSNGKLDATALPDPVAVQPAQHVLPQTATEHKLAAIVASVVDQSEVSVNSRFFDLGGDSIRAIQLASLARQAGLLVSVRDVFAHQTVRELSARVDAGTTQPAQSLRDARNWWSALLGGLAPIGLPGSAQPTTAPIPPDVLESLATTAHAAYGTTDVDLLLTAVVDEVAAATGGECIGAWVAGDGGAIVPVAVAVEARWGRQGHGPGAGGEGHGPGAGGRGNDGDGDGTSADAQTGASRHFETAIRAARDAARASADRGPSWLAVRDDPTLEHLRRPDVLIATDGAMADVERTPEAANLSVVVTMHEASVTARGAIDAGAIASRLSDVVRHCAGTGPSYAIEDFPDAGLDSGQLARVLANLGVDGAGS